MSTTKLHQVIAIADGRKTRAASVITKFHHIFGKEGDSAVFKGLSRTYKPFDADSNDKQPSETKLVQDAVVTAIRPVLEEQGSMLDVILSQDAGNAKAKADIKVDGKTVYADVPVTTLLFLEKRLLDVQTLITKLPILDPAESWKWDANRNCYATDVTKSLRTKKTPRAFEKAPATEKHPAQVELLHEDIPVGEWSSIKFSGALPANIKAELETNITKLLEAVKIARVEANGTDISFADGFGKTLLGYVFSPLDAAQK